MAKKKKKAVKKTATKPVEKAFDPEKEKLITENIRLKAAAERKQGIKNAKPRTIEGEQPRPDELMKGHIRSSAGKSRKDMTEAEVVSVEREIRKGVKKGGQRRDRFTGKLEKIEPGWRKGLDDDKKAYIKILLERMGRDPEKPTWDESIQVPGMSAILRGKSHKL